MAKIKKQKQTVKLVRETELGDGIKVKLPETQTLITRALSLNKAGNRTDAQLTMQRAVRLEIDNAPLVYLLARLFFETKSYGPCTEALKHAIKLDEQNLTYRRLLGDAYRNAAALDKAAEAYVDAHTLSPNTKIENFNLGHLLYTADKTPEAINFLGKAYRLEPQDPSLALALAAAQIKLEQYEAASQVLKKFCDDKTNRADIYRLYGVAQAALHKNAGAIQAFKEGLQHDPNDVQTYNNLAAIEQLEHLYGSALKHLTQSLALSPEQPRVLKNLAYACISALDNGKAVEYIEQAAAKDSQYAQAALFIKSYTLFADSKTLLADHMAWDKVHGAEGKHQAFSHSNKPTSRKKLNIGYLSPDFHNHAVAHFIQEILAHHDRTKVDVSCFAQIVRRDHITEKVADLTDHWHEIQSLSDFQVAQLIYEQDIDVLVDLGPHVTGNRTRSLTWRPAPVQVSYLGYPGSSGLECIDYWLTDTIVHPDDSTEASTETKFQLPRCWTCYSPPHDKVDIVERTEADYAPTFGVVNHVSKFSAASYKTWAEILHQCPNARLLIKSPALADPMIKERLKANLRTYNAPLDRIDILGSTPKHADHFLTYNDIDICLDTFPYSGGTSTTDALWMGTPVITLMGSRLAERMSASMLYATGMGNWVTETTADYITLAVQCHADIETIRGTKHDIRNQLMTSPLRDGQGIASALEDAYFTMYQDAMERSS